MNAPERKTPACVGCGKPMNPSYRPFCSRRCADVDLHRWLLDGYAIPGDLAEDMQSPEDEAEGR
jgi:uncharacterized protein